MAKLVWIAAGGGAGSVLRYLVSGWGQRLGNGSFPIGTLIVNVVGCLIIGVLAAAFAGPVLVREEHRMAVMVGVLGGFTTFSTFSYETVGLANEGQFARAGLNILLNNALGLAAAWVGYRLAQKWLGA